MLSEVVDHRVRKRRQSGRNQPAMFSIAQRIGRAGELRPGPFHEKSNAGTERNRVEDVLAIAVPRLWVRGTAGRSADVVDSDKGVGGVGGAGKSMRVAEVVLEARTQNGCRCGMVDVDDRVGLKRCPAVSQRNVVHWHQVVHLH